MKSFEEVAAFIRQNEVGRRACVETPFGRRLMFYADLTATGRYLHFVERWVERIRPFYANTHTAVSSTGRITTALREKAREVVKRAVGAGEDDVVLFTGAGATAAVNKLVGLLGLRIDEPLERTYGLSQHIPSHERPVVFLGPYEHHSNELPWVESIAEVVEIELDAAGRIDVEDLRRKLAAHAERPLKVGSFSAASNVTGVLSDVAAIARVLHRGGAFAVFDYAAAGPYVPIDMHPADPEARIDGLFLSTHKFVGGPQASGLLVANRALFRGQRPERPGGGTVHYVAGSGRDAIDYVQRLDEREEAGTPAIIGDVRAGTAFLVREMIGAHRIREHEVLLARRALERLHKHPRIELLGPHDLPRLAILSFNIRDLHHDLVSVLLDHLFGIQNRAGCSCAGPYGHRLLGIDLATSTRFRSLIRRGVEGIKPGWVRVTIPFYANEQDVEFLLSAIEFVADHGQAFVPRYRLSWRDGVWRHVERPAPDIEPIELTVEALEEAAQSFAAGDHEAPMSDLQVLGERARYLEDARDMARALEDRWSREPPEWNLPSGEAEVDALRWFDYVHAHDMPVAPNEDEPRDRCEVAQ
ncbi:aminotransferase class V-fold PLP-dependent enzyme [Paraliomyxa miuraensis]|uniref:aminotransferase class V-fold PLP-dependent enzyme n=1 Tax=Paraliomyxa miuraensis TaxID=376150 RepID=UPI00224E2021|nr:aminotransferase class V-fold PLP-dependent enzyme [Paraliomyxa miuraensis]MCX4247348.1 aminotransferase class V-fold PLP-dependent enzyme [Paraliomyxa miuraensis]